MERFYRSDLNNEPEDPSRRLFVRNSLAALSSALVGAGTFAAMRSEASPYRQIETPTYNDANQLPVDTEPELSQSAYFNDGVAFHTERFEQDMDVIVDRGELLLTLRRHFKLAGIDDPLVRQELEEYILGIAIAESRVKHEAVESKEGAYGFLQIMPGTWDDLAKEGESKDNLIDNIAVAVRLVEQTYRHITQSCNAELAYIQKTFFADQEGDFKTMFLVPVLINAYNAGMGSMVQLIKWFVEAYPTPEATVDLFSQTEPLSGYDVFIALAYGAHQAEVVQWYKDEASNYTTKVYAAYRTLFKPVSKNDQLVRR